MRKRVRIGAVSACVALLTAGLAGSSVANAQSGEVDDALAWAEEFSGYAADFLGLPPGENDVVLASHGVFANGELRDSLYFKDQNVSTDPAGEHPAEERVTAEAAFVHPKGEVSHPVRSDEGIVDAAKPFGQLSVRRSEGRSCGGYANVTRFGDTAPGPLPGSLDEVWFEIDCYVYRDDGVRTDEHDRYRVSFKLMQLADNFRDVGECLSVDALTCAWMEGYWGGGWLRGLYSTNEMHWFVRMELCRYEAGERKECFYSNQGRKPDGSWSVGGSAVYPQLYDLVIVPTW